MDKYLRRAEYYAKPNTSNIPLEETEVKEIKIQGNTSGIDFYLQKAIKDLERARYSAFEPKECDGRYSYFMSQASNCARAIGMDISDKLKPIWNVRTQKRKEQVLNQARQLAEAGNADKLDESFRYLDNEYKYIDLAQEQLTQLKVELDGICYQRANDSPSRITVRRIENSIAQEEQRLSAGPENGEVHQYWKEVAREFYRAAPGIIRNARKRIDEIKQLYGLAEHTQEVQ